jgi:hypothetical protein
LRPKPAEIATNFNDFSPTIASNTRLKNSAGRAGGSDRQGLRERSMLRSFSRVVRELWRINGEGSGSYRPDLHYMRGPGPKWHAKHAGFLAATPPAAKASRQALHDIAEHRA